MKTFADKRVVLVGGSSGIGLRVAEQVADRGGSLVILGRNLERLSSAKTGLEARGATVQTHQVDAHDHEKLASTFETMAPIDHVVSMVGDVMGGGFLRAEMAVIRHVIESKLFTNIRIGQLAATRLREGGSLVFTSGTGGRAQDACGSYIGNLGINALVEGLAAELAPRARANAVCPTWTMTPFWRDVPAAQVDANRLHFEQTIPLRRLASIDELAMAYVFLMENGFITGQQIAVDGGIMLGV